MPQHLWNISGHAGNRRYCEVCDTVQTYRRRTDGRDGWEPAVSPICPGDDEHNNDGRRRPIRPKPLEDA